MSFQKDPRLTEYPGGNIGTPLELVDGLTVPASLFFVRCNHGVPRVDSRNWRLRVDGFVDRPVGLSLSDLKKLPRRTITAFLECAGNSRTKFDPVPEGTPWVNDAAGNATWTGTSLSNLLDLAGVKRGTVDIISQGGDDEKMQRGLPIHVARDPDVLVAWEMNGQPLPEAHGAPARLLVPRWAGIASTKWLSRLTALPRPFDGFYNADNYVLYTPEGEGIAPVREMGVKSLIATPADGSEISAGSTTISGYAWSGYSGITRVEVSTDDGATWSDAEIVESAGRISWVRFEYAWDAAPGEHRIMSRAFDERGLRQPKIAPWNLKGYQNNGIQVMTIRVR